VFCVFSEDDGRLEEVDIRRLPLTDIKAVHDHRPITTSDIIAIITKTRWSMLTSSYGHY
jgi:hypothetical protein